MVKIININTKTRTIHVSNADGDIKAWRTTESGAHFPIKEGESTKEALDKFVEKKQQPAKKEPGYFDKKERFARDKEQAEKEVDERFKKQQLDRLAAKGTAWGKENVETLRKLGEANPAELKKELDRKDADAARAKKAHEEWKKQRMEKKIPLQSGDIVKIKYSDGSYGAGKVNCFTYQGDEVGCEVEDDQGRLKFYPKKQLEVLKYVPESEITDGWTNDSYYKGIKGEHMRAELYKDPEVKESARKRVERSQRVEAETGISPEDWEAYESVRRSGAVNMHDYAYINYTTGLPRETIRKIQENYEKLQEAYGQE